MEAQHFCCLHMSMCMALSWRPVFCCRRQVSGWGLLAALPHAQLTGTHAPELSWLAHLIRRSRWLEAWQEGWPAL
jgi:hypothetical protein